MVVAVAVFMLAMGVAIATVWTRDIVAGMQVDLSDGFFRARDDAGTLFWPHWIAEYGTAAGLAILQTPAGLVPIMAAEGRREGTQP